MEAQDKPVEEIPAPEITTARLDRTRLRESELGQRSTFHVWLPAEARLS